MIKIYDSKGNELLDVLITKECVKTEELMSSDFIQLSWKSADNAVISAGSYIIYNDEKYYLTEPYSPTQKDEIEYSYTPKFQSRVMLWQKLPFFLYTNTESGELHEPDWQLTSNYKAFLDCVVTAIERTTGEVWTYDNNVADIPASAYLHFDNTDIYSALNSIANAFETEWYADKGNNHIHFGKIALGEEIVLEVGENINVPSVTTSNEGHYNRFYAFGSSRNIQQDTTSGIANTIANKRLTLNKAKYPKGYYDTEENIGVGNTFVKTLYFDDVYPRATMGTEGSKGLAISNVRVRLMYWIDEETNGKIQIGTTEDGKPIYDMYAIWYFQIPTIQYSKEQYEIAGLTPYLSFENGALQGYEFEYEYHDKAKTLTSADGTPFEVQAGDFEIFYIDENNIRIPSLEGLIPSNGNEVALFNIALPDEYVTIAQDDLERAMLKEIDRLKTDYNSYNFKSNPIAFAENNPNLSIGRKVRYINGTKELSTRVKALTTQLDYPIEQTITIGNSVTKGTISQLKEDVANANTNINLVQALSEQTQSILDAYKRTQDLVLQGLNVINQMWSYDGVDTITSEFNVVSKKAISAKGKDTDNSTFAELQARIEELEERINALGG